MTEHDHHRPRSAAPPAPWRRGAPALAASLCTSVLTLLAFPPFGLWPLIFAAPVPLLWAAERAGDRRLGPAAGAALGAAPLWAWESQWIFAVSAPGVVLMIIYLSLFTGLFVWWASWTSRRLGAGVWLLGPLLWLALDMLRGAVLWHGYPWLLAAHPLIDSPWLARAASVVGVYGVSLLTVAAGSAAGVVLLKRGRARTWGIVSLAAIAAVWGTLSMPRATGSGRELRVAVVQTNVPQSLKGAWSPPERVRDLDRMLELTIEACAGETRPELVVWPETMFPGAALDPASLAEEREAKLVWYTDTNAAWPGLRRLYWRGPEGTDEPIPVTRPFAQGSRLAIPTTVAADTVLVWQSRLNVPMLIGADGIDGLQIEVMEGGTVESSEDARYNSTYLVQSGRVMADRYDKMHLTPFGEVMPYISRWRALESLFLRIGVGAAGMQFNLDAGSRPVTHTLLAEGGPVRIATPICFEGIMPGVCRRLAYDSGERRADLFVQVTNEGWFGAFDPAREQHLQIVRWRALELGVSIVRAANTGISAAIDPSGRIIRRGVEDGDANTEGVLRAAVPLAGAPTPYGRMGDIVGWSCLGLAGLVTLAAGARGGRASRARPGADNTGRAG
ncbi:MAG TPA: apolipoprotein N-acyltransferase [Phycisphaerales bacterium]|nr:apolipoprotein N-acyltransferase [Phycisphaerales bacterium]